MPWLGVMGNVLGCGDGTRAMGNTTVMESALLGMIVLSVTTIVTGLMLAG
jgi:hypothetical protein